MTERYAQLMEDLEILNLMKKEFEDDIEMREYLEFKIKQTQNELTQIDNAWFYDEI